MAEATAQPVIQAMPLTAAADALRSPLMAAASAFWETLSFSNKRYHVDQLTAHGQVGVDRSTDRLVGPAEREDRVGGDRRRGAGIWGFEEYGVGGGRGGL